MIAGIDFSTKSIDVVLLEDEGNVAARYDFPLKPKTRQPFDRVRDVVERMPTRSWWEDHGVWLVGIEDPFSAGLRVAKVLGMVAGALLTTLPPDVCVIATPPSEWQPMFCDPGEKVSKHAIARASRRWLGPVAASWPQDAHDAAGIAWTVRELNERGIRSAA